jgi:hypothetical protein
MISINEAEDKLFTLFFDEVPVEVNAVNVKTELYSLDL